MDELESADSQATSNIAFIVTRRPARSVPLSEVDRFRHSHPPTTTPNRNR